MKSMQHVLWRGALGLGLIAVGVGTGIVMPPAATAGLAERCGCPANSSILVVEGGQWGIPGRASATAFVVRRDTGSANLAS